ncbi:MAG: hypothetical protein RL119_1414 [Actinomycetota bacterium]
MKLQQFRLMIAIGSLTYLTACGSSADSQTMSDAEFCQEIERLESAEPTNDIGGAVDILRDLVEKAPNTDVREALKVLQPAFEELANIDENDPEAMSGFFELLTDKKIVAASETLDRYSTEVCGFTNEDGTVNSG